MEKNRQILALGNNRPASINILVFFDISIILHSYYLVKYFTYFTIRILLAPTLTNILNCAIIYHGEIIFRGSVYRMEDFTTFICYELKATMKKVEKHIGQEMSLYGLNMVQSFILFTLLEKDGSTLSEIGQRAKIENSSLTTMVDKLEKDNLVERRLNAQDRRVIRLFLTEKGRDLAQKVLQAGWLFNQELRKQLGSIEKDFLKSLAVISDVIDETEK